MVDEAPTTSCGIEKENLTRILEEGDARDRARERSRPFSRAWERARLEEWERERRQVDLGEIRQNNDQQNKDEL